MMNIVILIKAMQWNTWITYFLEKKKVNIPLKVLSCKSPCIPIYDYECQEYGIFSPKFDSFENDRNWIQYIKKIMKTLIVK